MPKNTNPNPTPATATDQPLTACFACRENVIANAVKWGETDDPEAKAEADAWADKDDLWRSQATPEEIELDRQQGKRRSELRRRQRQQGGAE